MIDKVVGSLLAPWQKIEALRGFVLPSVSYALSSGFCSKNQLFDYDKDLHNGVRRILDLPDSCSVGLFHADRSVGGLALPKLSQDADIWTITRAVRLLCSDDPSITGVAADQLAAVLNNVAVAATSDNAAAYLSGGQSG